MWMIITIPFLGTTLGAACVFFFKNKIGDKTQHALIGFILMMALDIGLG